jgi:hypothetical protein
MGAIMRMLIIVILLIGALSVLLAAHGLWWVAAFVGFAALGGVIQGVREFREGDRRGRAAADEYRRLRAARPIDPPFDSRSSADRSTWPAPPS